MRVRTRSAICQGFVKNRSPSLPKESPPGDSVLGRVGGAGVIRVALVLACSIGPLADAGASEEAPEEAPEAGVPGREEAGLSFTAGVDFPTAYFDRGILYEDGGLFAQPWAELDATLVEDGEGWLDEAHLLVGTWGSLHTHAAEGTHDPEALYEADLYATLSLTSRRVTVDATWWLSTSPSGAFAMQHEAFLGLSADDADLWCAALGPRFRGFQPYARLGVELREQSDDGLHEGVSLQVGAVPAFLLGGDEETAPVLSFPVEAGFSLGDYYEDETGADDAFGYASLGATLATPLARLCRRLEGWSVTLGGQALFLGDHASAFAGGDDVALVGTLGFATSF
jgi:hypothetical protein